MNKCLNHSGRFGLFSNFGFIAMVTLWLVWLLSGVSIAQGTDSIPSMVKTEWCLKQVETIAKKENDCRRELSKTSNELAKSKGQRSSIVEKLGIAAIGGAIVASQFNAVGLVIGGYLILFQ